MEGWGAPVSVMQSCWHRRCRIENPGLLCSAPKRTTTGGSGAAMFKRVANRYFSGSESDDDASCGTPDASSDGDVSGDERTTIVNEPKQTSRARRRKQSANVVQRALEEDGSQSVDEAGEPECVEGETPQEEHFRGLFHCKLCPRRILLSERDLTTHLASKAHMKREALWNHETQKKSMQQHKSVGDKKQMVTTVLRDATDATRPEVKLHKKKRTRRHRENASPEEIERKKEKFRRKKQRRAERTQAPPSGEIC